MPFLFSLSITLETLGEEDLHVLGNVPSLSELYIQVKKPTQGRDKRLVIDNAYPFRCLKRFSVKCDTMELKFARGAMQSLNTLLFGLENVHDTLLQFGDLVFGLDNLSLLEHIVVELPFHGEDTETQKVRNAIQKEVGMNQNMPILTFTEAGGDEDARADNFINKFRQQLKQQRIDSLMRYRDMLRRAQLKKQIASGADPENKIASGADLDK